MAKVNDKNATNAGAAGSAPDQKPATPGAAAKATAAAADDSARANAQRENEAGSGSEPASIESPPDHAKAQSGEGANAPGEVNAGDGTPVVPATGASMANVQQQTPLQLPTYTVLSPLDYDNRRYGIGATVELDERTAAPLVAAGVVSSPANS